MRLPRRLAALAAVAIVSVPTPSGAQANGFEQETDGLDFAVNLAFLPDGRILVAEKATGQIRVVEDGALLDAPLVTLPVDATANETGLLGLAVDPSFPDEPWVYAYYSDASDGKNHLVRMSLDGDTTGPPDTLFDEIATTPIHDGGDLAFGRDATLFLVTGEGGVSARSQDRSDPHGKVLRFERDGSIPSDNPVAGSPMYALGIRNSFGLCVDPTHGSLWETENGPDSWDEVNRIRAGENHGWPDQLGPGGAAPYVDPVIGFEEIIVPTGCAADLARGRLFVGDFGGRLHVVVFPGGDAPAREEVVATFPDAITDVAWGNDGALYVLTTSTLYRASGEISTASGSPGPPGGGPASSDDGFGAALRNTAGLVILGLFVLGFVWLRSRALKR